MTRGAGPAEAVQALSSPPSRPDTEAAPRVVPAPLALVALCFALLTSAAELLMIGALVFGGGRHLWYAVPELVWMLPLAHLPLFGGLSLAFYIAGRLRARPPGLRAVVTTLSVPAALSVLLFAESRMHDAALAVLGLGVAVQAGRMVARQPSRFLGLMRISTGWMAAALMAASVWVVGSPVLAERRALAALPPAREGAPNVLLIILDTVRGQNLSLYGYPRPTTPNLERLAGQGVRFDHAIATAPWTLPSHASMFTGRSPEELGVGWTRPLGDAFPTLAEALRDQGYVTGAFVANHRFAGRTAGFGRGFLRFEDVPRSVGQVLMSSSLVRWLSRSTELRHAVGYHEILGREGAPLVQAKFLDWMQSRGGRPFFAFLNFFDAHAPYLPPAPFDSLFGPLRPQRDPLLVEEMNLASQWTPDMIQAEIDAYDGAIAYLDEQLSRLVRELERRGVLANTLVIVTSDHGEEFGEHGLLGHGHSLYGQLLRVPLVLSLPGRFPAGRVVREPVSLRDLPATIMEAAAPGSATSFPGATLARFWNSPAPPAGEPVFATEEGMRSVIAHGHHYIRYLDGREELFDIAADPLQREDLSADPAKRAPLHRLRRLVGAGPSL